jgi:hypothetical protein
MKKDDSHGSADAGESRMLSRRKFLKVSVTGAAIAGAGGLSACVSAVRGGKTSKVLALYQDTPNRGRRCAGCTYFRQPNGCEIVAGEISPNGWCRFYEARAA